MVVRYVGMPSQRFLDGVPIVMVTGASESNCAINEDHILHPGVIDFFSEIGTDIAERLRPLPEPEPKPWGTVRIVPTDLQPGERRWEITQSGIYVPIPRHFITEKLRISLQAVSTEALRFFRPAD